MSLLDNLQRFIDENRQDKLYHALSNEGNLHRLREVALASSAVNILLKQKLEEGEKQQAWAWHSFFQNLFTCGFGDVLELLMHDAHFMRAFFSNNEYKSHHIKMAWCSGDKKTISIAKACIKQYSLDVSNMAIVKVAACSTEEMMQNAVEFVAFRKNGVRDLVDFTLLENCRSPKMKNTEMTKVILSMDIVKYFLHQVKDYQYRLKDFVDVHLRNDSFLSVLYCYIEILDIEVHLSKENIEQESLDIAQTILVAIYTFLHLKYARTQSSTTSALIESVFRRLEDKGIDLNSLYLELDGPFKEFIQETELIRNLLPNAIEDFKAASKDRNGYEKAREREVEAFLDRVLEAQASVGKNDDSDIVRTSIIDSIHSTHQEVDMTHLFNTTKNSKLKNSMQEVLEIYAPSLLEFDVSEVESSKENTMSSS